LTSARASSGVTTPAFGGIATSLTLPDQCLDLGSEPVITVRASRSDAPGSSRYLIAMSRQAGAMGGKPSARLAAGTRVWHAMQPRSVASLSIDSAYSAGVANSAGAAATPSTATAYRKIRMGLSIINGISLCR
jgi:hypothetical protein